MKQTLKIGFVTLVVAAVAASGLAFAQSGGSDEPVPSQEAPADGDRGFRGRGGHHRGGLRTLEQVEDILGVDAQDIREQLEAGSTLAEIAEANGSSGDELVGSLVAELSSKLDEKVAEEAVTAERADEILANADEKLTELVNSTQEEIQAAREDQRAERQAEREERKAERQATVEGVIGIPFDDIQAALDEGTSLADIAAGEGVDLDTLVAGLIAPMTENLQEKVADGTITQEQADERLATMTERLTERVQADPGDRDFRRGHGRRGHGPGGGFEGGPDFAPPATDTEVVLSA